MVLTDVTSQLGLSCVIPEGLGSVTVNFDDVNGESAIREICRQLNLGVRLEDKVLILTQGEGRSEAFGVFYRGQDLPDELADVGRTVVGKGVSVKRIGERVVVSGEQEDVERMANLLSHLRAAASDTWMLDVALVSLGKSVRRDAGLDWTVGGGAGVDMSAGTGRLDISGPVFGARAAASVAVVLRAVEEGREASTVTRGTLLLVEGQKASLQQGESVPLPRRSISPEGVVTVVGYDNIQTGFNLEAEAHRVEGGVSLKLRPRLSGVTGFQGEQPIIAERTCESTVELKSGEWIVISGLDDSSDSRSYTGLPRVSRTRLTAADRTNLERDVLVVLVRATRVRQGGT
jgi:type II secretory pathway component GspD/PulD (secretin)